MNIVHLVVVKNSFYILESGRTIRKSAHFSLILGTKNLVKYWDSTREACFGFELKADQIYRCDITIKHRRAGDSSGALLSDSLLETFFLPSLVR